MIIKPSIRSNVFTNAHPIGCKQNVENQINEAKKLTPFKGPKNVLIIGGSSGYGLASRIALAYGAGANTINISYEAAPKNNRTGSAGWWNNIYFQEAAKELPTLHKDFVGDAFSLEMKQEVADYISKTVKKVDLVIYSLAAGARKDETTGDLVRSHIKTIGEPATGKTIDISEKVVKELSVTGATEQEVKDTVFVMGGSDWRAWIQYLLNQDLLSEGFKTISYTYIGGPTTDKIYRGGSLGFAKEDLEQSAYDMNEMLKERLHGEALISSSKAVVTKASVFIPQMPHYVSCLFEVMMKHHVHETILEHKFRLFKDMIYGNKRIVDEKNRIRLDHLEMDPKIQKETIALMTSSDDDTFFELEGTKRFLKEVHQIHGFEFDDIDYDQDVDLEKLSEKAPV
ncbi:MAG: enoyl-[acyl-carrier-protein] reductase FabV [Tenericutes bacterium HGW-Tenericutes-6]|jgi:enoyl-[acyl-carrier protein] reductase/trans-2-enoyl-CoA reductase (NAD+)|nr:MAG: enoyl-[acyl-carrier-protein] reductase FabV [Tenericutes bacterium HGW-Tenericutes-6]